MTARRAVTGLAVLDVLARYEVVTQSGITFTLCRRCPHLMVTARDLDGDQDGVTVAELVEQVLTHEWEDHRAEAPAGLRDLLAKLQEVPDRA
jgi:hypothetical protein